MANKEEPASKRIKLMMSPVAHQTISNLEFIRSHIHKIKQHIQSTYKQHPKDEKTDASCNEEVERAKRHNERAPADEQDVMEWVAVEVERIAQEMGELEEEVSTWRKGDVCMAEERKIDKKDVDEQLFETVLLHNIGKLVDMSSCHSILRLASTCCSFHKLLSPVISSFVFSSPKESMVKFSIYEPRKIALPYDYYGTVSAQLLPAKLTHLTCGELFNDTLDDLPESITHLTLHTNFNQNVDYLPRSIRYLYFGRMFNRAVDHLPVSLVHLSFGLDFHQKVDHLPSSLEHLKFGRKFNYVVDHLPSSLTHLQFGTDFNQAVNKLPSSLTDLSFGKSFVQPVDHLPQALRHLRFGYKFNHSVDHLPNLETLTLGNAFTRSIDLLPQTLTKLTVEGPGAFNQKIPSLPNLTNLSISSQFNQPLDHLPSSVTSLVLLAISKVPASKTLTHLCCYGDLISSIPDSLTSLNCTRPSPATMEIISKSSISSLEYTLQNVGLIHCLPESLTTLVLTRFTRFSMTTKIAYLPASLTRLEFHGNLKVYSANNLPPSLTHLILFSCTQPIDCFPPNLTHLSFASTFNHSITGKLPQTLKSLELGTGFSQPLRSLPLSLKVLTVTRHAGTEVLYGHTHIDIPQTLAMLIIKVHGSVDSGLGPELRFNFPPNEL